jgi:hypothetical protein
MAGIIQSKEGAGVGVPIITFMVVLVSPIASLGRMAMTLSQARVEGHGAPLVAVS